MNKHSPDAAFDWDEPIGGGPTPEPKPEPASPPAPISSVEPGENVERALIGALVQDPDAVLPIVEAAGLTAASFTDPVCIRAWGAIARLRAKKRAVVDLLTVPTEMDGDAGTNMVELGACVSLCPTVAHAGYYAEQIAETERRRKLSDAARMAADALAKGGAVEVIAAQLKAAGEAARGNGGLAVQSLADFLAAPPPPLDCVVEELFEAGDKGELIAPSKARKSFFLLDLGAHIAAGRDWLCFKIPRPRRVLLFNLEIKPEWMKRRFYRRLAAYGITPEEIRDTFFIVNARGRGQAVRAEAVALTKRTRAEVVFIDPRYKLLLPTENENAGEGMQGVLDLQDQIAEAGAAAILVGHDGKGTAGDRDDRDRGAGSSRTGRDCDFRLVLSPHADDPENAAVLSIMRRNFPPFQDFTLRHVGDAIQLDVETAPRKETTFTRRQGAKASAPLDSLRPAVLEFLRKEGKPLPAGVLEVRVQEVCRIGLKKARALIAAMVDDAELADTPRQAKKGGEIRRGLPEQIESWMNPALPTVAK